MTATATCEMITNCKPRLVWALQPQADSDCSWLGAVGLEQALEKELPGLPCRGQPHQIFLIQLGPKPPPSDCGFTKIC